MEELQVLDGDIVCLQEVGPKYFYEKLNPSMSQNGYKGLLQVYSRSLYYFRLSEYCFTLICIYAI